MNPQLHYYQSGEGFPVIFFHGFCESSNIWQALSEELSDQFQVICPDLPGFGNSPLPVKKFSLEEIADMLVEWAKAQGIDRCIVIGHSLGGYIALELLRKYPHFVKGIGLFNSSAFEDSADKKANRNKLIDFIQNNGVAPFISTFVPSLFYPKTIENHQTTIDQLRESGKAVLPESVIKYAAAMRDRPDSTDLLTEYHDRMLLISGEYDQNVPIEKSIAMAEYLDKENVHIIPDSAHMSLFEHSELCYDAIRQFVKRLVGR